MPAAAVGALEWGCEDGGTPFHVGTFEGVAALVALECCYSSYHSSKLCYFVLLLQNYGKDLAV